MKRCRRSWAGPVLPLYMIEPSLWRPDSARDIMRFYGSLEALSRRLPALANP